MDVDENMVAVVVVEGIYDTMELMVIITQIPIKGKPLRTTRSGIIPRLMRIIVIDVV